MDYQITVPHFSLQNTLECGQCFRWKQQKDGSYYGVAKNRGLHVCQDGETLTFFDTDEKAFLEVWNNYFDFDTDYDHIYDIIGTDESIRDAYTFTGGIHILRQDPWEALCSFILSQNNNIPRITGIIDRLCQNFGVLLPDGSYSFPSAYQLAKFKMEDFSVLRAGFRTKYLLDAAQKVADGRINFTRIKTADLGAAREELQQINGVGPKVAECALLFGFYRLEAFPVDVWIKRVLNTCYPNGFPEVLKPYGGIAQQILFHYVRCCPSVLKDDQTDTA